MSRESGENVLRVWQTETMEFLSGHPSGQDWHIGENLTPNQQVEFVRFQWCPSTHPSLNRPQDPDERVRIEAQGGIVARQRVRLGEVGR